MPKNPSDANRQPPPRRIEADEANRPSRLDESLRSSRRIKVLEHDAKRSKQRIERLEKEARTRDERIASLLREIHSRDVELQDLRAVRDALTPPDLPARPMLELATSFAPAAQGVSGDFYLVAEGPGDSTVVAVGDVCGKGLAAARSAVFVRTALATFTDFVDDPCELLELGNRALVERFGDSGDFATAAVLVLRPQKQTIAWAAAGHQPPLWLDSGRQVTGTLPGLPLGLEDRAGCSSSELPGFGPGVGLLMFTDGLSEARREDGIRFGTPRVRALLRELRGCPPDDVVTRLKSAAEDFSGGQPSDDVCLVAMRAAA